MLPKLMSLSDKKAEHIFGVTVYHSSIGKIRPFVVVRVSNSFMYDVTGRKYKRTYVYKTLEEAEMKQYKLNCNFLSRNGLSLEEYNGVLTNLSKFVELDRQK